MSEMMKALVCHKNGSIETVDKKIPTLKEPTDAIVKVTLSSICTSDLHIKHGIVPQAVDNVVLGHEFVGEVVDVGSCVKKLKKGDRVSANCITFCAECFFCKRGFINNCIKGGWKLGCRIDGAQAEFVRVPFSDCTLTKIPSSVSDEAALFVGDILSSGYFAAQLCEIKREDTILVIGAGPVGLCAMMCARLLGASKIIASDINQNRLEIAKAQGLADFVINPLKEDVSQFVKNLTCGHGADGVIEAAGTSDTFKTAWQSARANAVVALVAMYESEQILPLPEMYGKNLTFKTGGVDAIHCEELLKFIENGQISTDFLISEKFSLNDALEAYRVFESRKSDCLKIALTPYEH